VIGNRQLRGNAHVSLWAMKHTPCPPSPSPLAILTLLLSVTKRKGKNLVVLRVNSAKGQARQSQKNQILNPKSEILNNVKERSAVSSQQLAVSMKLMADS